MSTVFGIYNRNQNTVKSKIVDGMHDALAYWGPDASGCWCDGGVALGHEMLWNTPESKHEHLPIEHEQFVLTMDARLDNRRELVKLLGLGTRSFLQITDSELILAAYSAWGEDCPKYLVGDFAFVIWDKVKKKLFCARDHLGVKPFYFHLTESLFVFANDIKGIVVHPDVSRTLNDEAVANYLVHALLLNTSLTFFKDIHKLPAAHSLTISASSVRKQCYWRPEEVPPVKLPNAKAYAERLRELLEQAVHDRMRSAYSITSHLSGGLDSSAIAVIAARKLREKGEKLLAFNWLHEPMGNAEPNHHEWSHSAKIAKIEGIEHSYIPMSSENIAEYMGDHCIVYGDSAGFWYEHPIGDAVQQKGSRTILSGWGGDELSTYHGKSYLANMMRSGSLLEVLKGVWRGVRGRRNKVKLALNIFYHNIVMPVIPRRFYHKMPKSQHYKNASFEFAKQEFLAVLNKEKGKTPILSPQTKGTIKAHMLAFLQLGHLPARMESWAATAFSSRLEYSYPLLDKRIVEFILGVPADFFVHNGIGRHLFRVAVDDLLPNNILWSDKIAESNRVDRLLEMSLDAYRGVVRCMVQRKEVHSNYIDLKKLERALLQSNDDDLASLVLVAWGALSVIRCEQEKI